VYRLTLAAFVVPVGAGAQVSTFVMLRGTDTIAVERATRAAGRLDGELVLKAQGLRIRYSATLGDSGTMPRVESWIYRGADTNSLNHVVFLEQRDTMIVELAGSTQHIPTQRGALVYINPSPSFLEQVLLRARALGGSKVAVPLVAAAGGAAVFADVTWIGADSARFTLGGVAMNAVLSGDGHLAKLEVPTQGVRVVRLEGTSGPSLRLEQPGYSAPADAPYTAMDVTIRTPNGLTLAGTLTLPKSRPTRGAPAVVTITGSGTEERDESLPGVPGYRPFKQIADTLGRRGIAVLRLDDRGIGGSDAGPPGATSADFATDIEAALAFLRTRGDIDPTRLALVGHSEGGMIAPMVAAEEPKLHAIVLMAGPAHTGRAILAYQQRYEVDSMLGLTGARRDSALRALGKATDTLATHQPWLAFFLDYDPLATARRVKQPVLILQGETDRQVTPEQANELAMAFRAGGNRDVTVKLFPATDHLFLPDPSGNPSGYAALPSRSVRREVLGTLADWLAAHLR
jgi:alpha-beta hydrolase superfamily lysophospholipase